MRRSILLTAAFAALLVVIGALAIAVWSYANREQARVAALHKAHVETDNALASLRSDVYLTGILIRDYLYDTDPSYAQQYAGKFAEIRKSAEASFQVLAPATQNGVESSALERLHGEVNAYLDPTRIVLNWTPEQRAAGRAEFLRGSLRSREEIVALSGQMEQMISENFSRERGRIMSADREFRSSLAWATGLALLLGLGIAALTLGRMMALERRSQATESVLRRMSAQVRTAQEQERKYLSRELHDQVGQMLTGLRMELSALSPEQEDADSELSARIAHAKSIVEQTLGIVRNIAMLLRPSMLDDLGLTPALAWLVKEVSRSSGIEIEADVDPALDLLPDTHRTCLYRVVQEALTNVSKHAGAHKVDVSLRITGGWVVGTIADNGCGFDTTATPGDGLGLMGMEERVRELGGHVRVISTLGQGTRVEFRLPVPRTAQGSASEEIHDSHPDRGRSRYRPDRVETSA